MIVGDGAFSHNIYNIKTRQQILNNKGHPNCITGSRVTAILLNGWLSPFGGFASGKGLRLQPA